jgi:hypothetical protein
MYGAWQIRPKRATLVAILAGAVMALSSGGCGGGGTETFETPTYPFSFDYPADWKPSRIKEFTYGAGAGERTIAVQLKPPEDQVVVTQYKLAGSVPEGQPANQQEVDRIVNRLAKQSDGVASEAEKVEYGGIPGYRYVIEYDVDGKTLRNDITFLFRDDDEFQINCQSSPANREKVEEGCEKVLSTIQFD